MSKEEIESVGFHERGNYFVMDTDMEYYEYRLKWSNITNTYGLYIAFFKQEIPIRDVDGLDDLAYLIEALTGKVL